MDENDKGQKSFKKFEFVHGAAKPVNTEKLVQQTQGTPAVNEIETAMWYKEAGEMYRAGALKESNTDISPEHAKLIKQKYLNRMFKALGIDVQYE